MRVELQVSEIGGSGYKLMVLYYALGQGAYPSVAPQPGEAGLECQRTGWAFKKNSSAGPKFRKAGKFRPVQSDL